MVKRIWRKFWLKMLILKSLGTSRNLKPLILTFDLTLTCHVTAPPEKLGGALRPSLRELSNAASLLASLAAISRSRVRQGVTPRRPMEGG